MSGAEPVLRDSEHFFFSVGHFENLLREWFAGTLTAGRPVAHPGVIAKLGEWLNSEGGLRDWDISRDAPYFGFPIPDAPGKYFYVWLDAPVGYLASFKALCDARGYSFSEFLDSGSTAEMHHFIGKDIVNFHGLFWPAMLHGADFRVPTALHVNGYVTVNGEKMSKSRGTFIQARTWLNVGLNPQYLRYYFAAKSSGGVVDLDLNLEDFTQRVNADIVGKFVNIASRCAKLLETNFDNRLAADFWSKEAIAGVPEFVRKAKLLLDQATGQLQDAVEHYARDDFNRAIGMIMQVADRANEYIAETAPWALARDAQRHAELHVVLSTGINLFRAIACALKPILPTLVSQAEVFLALPEVRFEHFNQIARHLGEHRIQSYQPLATRVDPKMITAMIEASKESLATPAAADASPSAPGAAATSAALHGESAAAAVISMDDFARLDLRIGKVLECAFVDGSDKLLRFKLDAGELGERQIFSGIRAAYSEPEKLIGRNVVFIANLAPRKMRFGLSEGMILSAGNGGADLKLLDADRGAAPGAQVR